MNSQCKWQSVVAVLAAAVMLVSMMPTTVLADTSSEHVHCVCGGDAAGVGDHTACSDVTWTPWDGTGGFPGGNVYLTADVTQNTFFRVETAGNLCLNGHVISGANYGCIVYEDFNLCDCGTTGAVRARQESVRVMDVTTNIYGGFYNCVSAYSGNAAINTYSGDFTSYIVQDSSNQSGTIYGGNFESVSNRNTLTIYDGNFAWASSSSSCVENYDTTTIYGGTFTGATPFTNYYGTTTIYGGTFTGTSMGLRGLNMSHLKIKGGTITATGALSLGVAVSNGTTIYLSGSPSISGVKADINPTTPIVVDGPLTNTTPYRVLTNNDAPGVFAVPDRVNVTTLEGYVDNFVSTNAAYYTAVNGVNLEFVNPHVHSCTYTVSGAVITESCGCGHTATATLKAPTGRLVYNGEAQPAATVTYSDGWLGGTLTPFYGYTTSLQINKTEIVDAGTACACISIGGVTASVTYTVYRREVTVTWDTETALVYNGTMQRPAYTINGVLAGDELSLKLSNEGAVNAGQAAITVQSLLGKSRDNYTLTGATRCDFTIQPAEQTAPVDLTPVNEVFAGKGDGSIIGITSAMEYRKEGESTYTSAAAENLTAGTYYVRYKAKENYNASPDTAVTIGSGRKLTVTIPQNQVGYTLTVDKTQFDYMGGPTITLTIADGYSKTDAFAVKLNGVDVQWGDRTELPTQSCTEDLVITVEGIADVTAPTVKIEADDNTWTSFLNTITFGLFFNDTLDVTVTPADAGSGVHTIAYYLSDRALTLNEVKAITTWEGYNGTFSIDPDDRYVVYVKVTDNAGNTTYACSDGLTLDATAAVLSGVENGGTYYGDVTVTVTDATAGVDTVKVNGTPVTLTGDTFTVTANNGQNTIVVTDKAGNSVTYTVTVYKTYTVTYKADGAVVATQTVGYGKDATAPSIPTKVGYDQTAPSWDKVATNVTADTEVNAVYTINTYTVTYKADGVVVDTVTVEHGADATAPSIPTKVGYDQTAPTWDKASTNITADTDIDAVYTINTYTVTIPAEQTGYTLETDVQSIEHGGEVYISVALKEGYLKTEDFAVLVNGTEVDLTAYNNVIVTATEDLVITVEGVEPKTYTITFVDEDGNETTVTVKHGEAVTAPAAPVKEGYTVRWETTIDAATGDATVKAVYTKLPEDDEQPEGNGQQTSPDTGDHSPLWLWVALAFVSGSLLLGKRLLQAEQN